MTFHIVQAALGGRIHPIPSHASMPDDRAEVIETMWGYLSGAVFFQETGSHSQSFGLSLRTCDWFAKTTRGPVTITPVLTGRGHSSSTGRRPTGECEYTHTHEEEHTHARIIIQTNSCLSELHAGRYPMAIESWPRWRRRRHHANTRMISHTHTHTETRHMRTST